MGVKKKTRLGDRRPRWIVRYSDNTGSRHASHHYLESDAKAHVTHLLREFIIPVIVFVTGSYMVRDTHIGFTQDAHQLIEDIEGSLEKGDVWGAFSEWKLFEHEYKDEFEPTPLWMLLGEIEVDNP